MLFLSIAFFPQIGGMERIAAELLPALEERGFEFLVVVPKPQDDTQNLPPEADVEGIHVVRLPFWMGHRDIGEVMRLRRRMSEIKRSFSPALVHANAFGAADFFHSITARDSQAPTLRTLHGEWPGRFEPLLGDVLRAADWITVPSQATAHYALTIAPEVGSRLSVIQNACIASRDAICPIPFEMPRLLFLGRLSPEKGCDVALAAFQLVKERYPRVRLTVAGDGQARGELEDLVSELRIEDSVDFLGEVPPARVAPLFDASTLVIVPSRSEGFGLVALEAAHRGRPVVATRVGGLPEVVVHGETGIIVEPDDPSAIARAVVELLKNRPEAEKMGQCAQRRAARDFGWPGFVDSYERLYRTLIAGDLSASASPLQPEATEHET